jgi:hypothetical protein
MVANTLDGDSQYHPHIAIGRPRADFLTPRRAFPSLGSRIRPVSRPRQANLGSIADPLSKLDKVLGPVNTCMIAALLSEIRPGKARGVKCSGAE